MVVVAVVMKLPQGRAIRMIFHPHPPQSKHQFAIHSQPNSRNVNEFTFCNASQLRFSLNIASQLKFSLYIASQLSVSLNIASQLKVSLSIASQLKVSLSIPLCYVTAKTQEGMS
jgi:hypothetical protein